jgi:tetratricopeptide (TPR) repeat protein
MPPSFTLDLATDPVARRAALHLADGDGRHLAAHEVDLGAYPPARWAAAFDTRRHLRRMAGIASPEKQLIELGDFLGAEVLGPAITGHLARPSGGPTLLVRVAAVAWDPLAASFARVPWELARAPGDKLSLQGHAVTVRVAFAGDEAGEGVVVEPRGEAVRVLLVFADPPQARPLAARLERERLREMFFGDVLHRRNVEVDVLCHGVSRGRLRARIAERGGYHVVHWSGHGSLNALGAADGTLSGGDLVALFREAGGRVPEVVMLSAGASGAVAAPEDWTALRAEEGEKGGDDEEGDGGEGTALALLRAGVKQVVAMRWEVGDNYARRLARRFYRHLLGDPAHHPADKALALARGDLRHDVRTNEHSALDHATPVVLGAESVRFVPEMKRSSQKDRETPRPQPLLVGGSKDLDAPRGFVGRGEELTRLFQEWIGREGEKPVALIQGLAGLGKTSLAAETVHLGFELFDHVLAFQAKGTALGIEEMYRRIDQRLAQASPAYREKCNQNDRAKVFVKPEDSFKGPERYEQLAYNLLAAMSAERILLVLDNFETNLLLERGEYKCADPAWERLFGILSERLGETGSRVLVTSRHKPAVLEGKALWIPLGALPIAETKLYFQNHAALRALWHGDEASFALVKRILDVSRGHPLILARIADMARKHYDERKRRITPEGHGEIEAALDKLQGEGFRTLPDLFATVKGEAEREREHEYLNDVAIGAVDLLIERLTPDDRRLLWVLTRMNEPPHDDLIQHLWGGELPKVMEPLLGSGLLTHDEKDATYSFHELVAERAADWMKSHPAELETETEAGVWKACGDWYGLTFARRIRSRKPGSRDAAVEMGRRGIRYLVRARAFESLGSFASDVVNGTRDQAILGQVIADIQAVVGEAPAGKTRWSLRTYLAEALWRAGRSDQALRLYEQATEEAEAAADGPDVGWICQSWGHALRNVGELGRAREVFLRSAEEMRRAGRPRVLVVRSENEALRVDVEQGHAVEALPAIEANVAELRSWWARRGRGEPVPETPDDEHLSRTLVCGIEIASRANRALERWQPCLDLLGEVERVKHDLGMDEHEIARTRFHRSGPLSRLGKLDEARALLEGCIEVYRRGGDVAREAKALSSLADVWNALGDPGQALVLARQAQALRERLPSPEEAGG